MFLILLFFLLVPGLVSGVEVLAHGMRRVFRWLPVATELQSNHTHTHRYTYTHTYAYICV